jgi:hypothetical protein
MADLIRPGGDELAPLLRSSAPAMTPSHVVSAGVGLRNSVASSSRSAFSPYASRMTPLEYVTEPLIPKLPVPPEPPIQPLPAEPPLPVGPLPAEPGPVVGAPPDTPLFPPPPAPDPVATLERYFRNVFSSPTITPPDRAYSKHVLFGVRSRVLPPWVRIAGGSAGIRRAAPRVADHATARPASRGRRPSDPIACARLRILPSDGQRRTCKALRPAPGRERLRPNAPGHTAGSQARAARVRRGATGVRAVGRGSPARCRSSCLRGLRVRVGRRRWPELLWLRTACGACGYASGAVDGRNCSGSVRPGSAAP